MKGCSVWDTPFLTPLPQPPLHKRGGIEKLQLSHSLFRLFSFPLSCGEGVGGEESSLLSENWFVWRVLCFYRE